MNEHVASILAQLGQEPSDILQAAALPACWGFSSTPTLQQLQHDLKTYQDGSEEETTAHNRRDRSHVEAPESYLSILESSNAFASNHCIDAMAEAYGVSQFVTSLSGSLLASKLADSAVAAAALQAVKQQVDQAWSAEAVKRGVGCAKSGDYQQALECYNKALDLHPGNCDAYVARGAAHANQKHFEAAIADFQEALKLDPDNVNATKYLQATKEHMQATAATREARHAAQEQHKQQQQQRPQQQQQQQQLRLQQQAGNTQHCDSAEQQQNSHDPLRRIAGSGRQLSQRTRDIAKVDDERQQQRHQYHHKHSRRRSRSRSLSHSREYCKRGDRSSNSSDSSEQSNSSSDEQGVSAKAFKGPSAADIKEAIELVRSAKKARARDRHKSSGSSKKKKKHKHKHNSKHKHRKKHSR